MMNGDTACGSCERDCVTNAQCAERRKAMENACLISRQGAEKRFTSLDGAVNAAFERIDKTCDKIDGLQKIAMVQLCAVILTLIGMVGAYALGKL